MFVTFIALLAAEFSGGTFRALLLRDPHRLRVIVGKLAGILLVAAGVVALAEVLHVRRCRCSSRPTQDIATGRLVLARAASATAVRDYATVFAGVAGWAVFGTTLAVIFRSARSPSASASPGPARSRTSSSTRGTPATGSSPARSWPRSSAAAPSSSASAGPLLTAVLYTAIAAAVALVLVSRRDVTA